MDVPPRKKREIKAYALELMEDELASIAYERTAAKFGIHPTTVSKFVREQATESVQYSDKYPVTVSGYSTSTVNVELTRETTVECFISDIHWHPEYGQGHDPAAYAVTLELLKRIQPDILFFGGDIMDCYAPSRYDKIPRLATPEAFDAEIHFGRQCLAEVCAAVPNARKIWLTGNHELRLPRSVLTNAPWLTNKIQDVEGLLQLSQFEVETVDDGYKIGKLRHYHGHNLAGAGRVNTAKNKFERMLTNMIYGHHHKFASWYQRDQDGSYFGAFGNGTLHWLEAEYAKNPDWTQGVSFVQYSKAGNFHIDQVLIHKPSVWSPHAEVLYAGNHIRVDMQR